MSDPLGLINSNAARNAGGVNPLGPLGRSQSARPGQTAPDDAAANTSESFKDLMLKQLQEVNDLEREATQAIEDFETGKRQDFESVVLAMRKAEVATQMLLQLRNKVMTAYEEVKQIRV